MIHTQRLVIHKVQEKSPSIALSEEKECSEPKWATHLESLSDAQKWLKDPAILCSFIKELVAYRCKEGMLHFVGEQEGNVVAYIGITGMETDSPEIQITVAEPFRGCGYGREMLDAVLKWLFDHTDKAAFLYRVLYGNVASEHLAKSLGGVLREPKSELERALIKTFEIQRPVW